VRGFSERRTCILGRRIEDSKVGLAGGGGACFGEESGRLTTTCYGSRCRMRIIRLFLALRRAAVSQSKGKAQEISTGVSGEPRMAGHHQNFGALSHLTLPGKRENGVQALRHCMGCIGMKGRIFAAKRKKAPTMVRNKEMDLPHSHAPS
jgi:hypothetical protein